MAKVKYTSINSGRVLFAEGEILPFDKRSDRIVIRTKEKRYEDILVSTILEIEDDYSKENQ